MMEQISFPKKEQPELVFTEVGEVFDRAEDGGITAVHFPSYEDMDVELICEVLEGFGALESAHPKILIIDNPDIATHDCNRNTLERMIEEYRAKNVSVWIAGCSPSQLPGNAMDYSTLAILHQFTSKFWYCEMSDHLPITSSVFHHCQGLAPGGCVLVAPGSSMQHPIHSGTYCYPAKIIPPRPV